MKETWQTLQCSMGYLVKGLTLYISCWDVSVAACSWFLGFMGTFLIANMQHQFSLIWGMVCYASILALGIRRYAFKKRRVPGAWILVMVGVSLWIAR